MLAETPDLAVSPLTALRSRLAREFGGTVVAYAGPGQSVPPGMRLAVHVAEGEPNVVGFGRWARAARLPAVVITVVGERALVGPLSVPGAPGCAECARRRRVAAAAATPDAAGAHSRVAVGGSHRPARLGGPDDDPEVGGGAIRAADPDATSIVSDRVVRAADPDATSVVRDTDIRAADPDATGAVADPDATAAVGAELIDPEWTGSHGRVAGLLDLPPDPHVDRIVALLAGGARDLVDHVAEVVDGEVVWHRVIPMPSCEVCGGADGIGTVGLPVDDDPALLLEALAGWVDPLTGVIPWISVDQPLGPGLPFIATAAPPHRLDADGDPVALPIGWGKGMSRCSAIVSAVGEAVERYAASLPDQDRIVWARPADLSGAVLDPREFPLYPPESYARQGFRFAAFDRRVDHPWVRGTWLGTSDPVWVPAVFTFLSMTLLPEHLICQGTSNGLAAGVDAESATVRATLELVERDAMMAAWLTGAKGRYVELDDTLDPDLRALVGALSARGATVEVYLLPTTVYGAAVVALAVGDGRRWPGVAMGLGADRSPRAAIRGALMELAQTGPHLAALLRDRAHPVPTSPTDVRDMLDHAAYYFPADRVGAFDRIRCGGTSRLRDLVEPIPETSVADLAAVLRAAGVRAAVVDVTSADVATGPFRVVRVVSPDLQPISYGHGNEREPVRRLRERVLSSSRLNVHPIW